MINRISVIIPIYNAGSNLRRCLDSVIDQTATGLQIILVDDGSTDGSSDICDEYARLDSRIRVIHQQNCGVSVARNVGLEMAEGEWIGFVDADDWIEADMFAYLLENAESYGADTTVCALWEELPCGSVVKGVNEVAVLTGHEALELLLRDDVLNNYLWNKLWKRELFRGIIFPVGRSFEDVAVVYRLIEQSTRVVCLPKCKYHYRQHRGSILDQQSFANKVNFYLAARNRMWDLKSRYDGLDELLQASCISAAIGIWAAYCFNSRGDRQRYASLMHEIADFSRNHRFLVAKYLNLGFTGRIISLLTAYNHLWAFVVAGFLGRIYRLKHGRNI